MSLILSRSILGRRELKQRRWRVDPFCSEQCQGFAFNFFMLLQLLKCDSDFARIIEPLLYQVFLPIRVMI